MAKLLIVDDDIRLRKLVRTYGEVEHYECEEAADGLSALEKLQDSDFDLVILDDALVCQHKAQTGHAVRHTDNILFAADCRDQLIGKLIVVFSCHDLVLLLFDIFQNTHKNLTQLAFHCMLVSKSYLYCTVSGTVSQSQKQTPVLTKSNFSSNDTGKV